MAGTINVSQAEPVVHQRMRKYAQGCGAGWRVTVIDEEGKSEQWESSPGSGYTIFSQEKIFNSFPEINPRFFVNFNVNELVIRQHGGKKQIIIKRIGG